VGEKNFIKHLTHQNRLRIHFRTGHGEVVRLDVVQYEAEIDGEWLALVRYDCAHGYLHRDIIKPDGSREKSRVPVTDFTEALDLAIEELERQWRFYRRMYEEAMK
jgi:hypothetical protein